jgi:hypothetical protein
MVNEKVGFGIKLSQAFMALKEAFGSMLGQLVFEPKFSSRENDKTLATASKSAYVGFYVTENVYPSHINQGDLRGFKNDLLPVDPVFDICQNISTNVTGK